MSKPDVITGDDLPQEQQRIRYELATLDFRLPDADRAIAGIQPWVTSDDARGELLGAWQTEHGVLGRAYVLRGFVDQAELDAERSRARSSTAPFGRPEHLCDLTLNSYAPFPFVPPVRPGLFGSVYEIRDYHLVPGGLPGTIDGWRQKLPGRHVVDPITIVMYALDGPDRIVHIWPFAGLDERVEVRRRLVAEGKWPPPGGPERILHGTSTMAWPLPISPLH
ncbi:NIPSNAP family protein [Rudaeicoccus suwonensis]|uniref:NIPSNAP protein n=1 Tax=Rudaeicoccus suwonensis TaxID=657409 RepID=A0A561E439_9MICO|nr:NIPSNAP family protein [Rudaeicoccus suwonensis]TWE10387.1 NIPSNAP protein [Rudaeicoccus suwonensis]